MELSNEFVVPVGVDEAWVLLTDVERIAPEPRREVIRPARLAGQLAELCCRHQRRPAARRKEANVAAVIEHFIGEHRLVHAIDEGWIPTGKVWTTSLVLGSTFDTVPSSWLATHTAPPA